MISGVFRIAARQMCSKAAPKVNMKELSSVQLSYMKQIEHANLERRKGILKMRRKNAYCAFFLGGLVIAIFVYTIKSVRHEDFLDEDFVEEE